jgi:hypothetical protein
MPPASSRKNTPENSTSAQYSFLGQGQMQGLQRIKRRIYGWIGLQRFIHAEKYGIDLVRNGRVIEPQCKDLFYWTDGDKSELEYPIDDQRQRGRFIGVIHMDHCAVNYTKNRFVREDPAWREMVICIRGEGPLHPKKAEKYGFEPSDALLYRFFQAFRRNEPHLRGMPKTPHPWADHLAVPNYKTAEEMAAKFYAGDPEYQDDAKWFEPIQPRREKAVICGAGRLPNVLQDRTYMLIRPYHIHNKKERLDRCRKTMKQHADLINVDDLIAQVQRMMEECGNPEDFDARQWFNNWAETYVPALAARPRDLLQTKEGRQLVSHILAMMQSGTYA